MKLHLQACVTRKDETAVRLVKSSDNVHVGTSDQDVQSAVVGRRTPHQNEKSNDFHWMSGSLTDHFQIFSMIVVCTGSMILKYQDSIWTSYYFQVQSKCFNMT